MSISVVVVLYNSAIDNVPVVRAALASQEVSEIIACDNSTVSTDNAGRSKDLGVIYISMGGNKGLSLAYDKGIQRSTGDIICLFDDDTEVDASYFRAIEGLAKSEREWDLALPVVVYEKKILSPSRFNGFRSISFKTENDIVESAELSGINSGMVIRRALLQKVKHDSNLFLDLIDHKFVLDARQHGAKICILSGTILRQAYSLATDSEEAAISRLALFEHDARQFYSSTFAKRLYCEAMLFVRKLKTCLRFRSYRCFYPSKNQEEK